MKKRVFCILLSLLMLFSAASAQAKVNNFYLRTRYGQLALYENLVFNYSIGVYGGFYMYSDDQLNEIWSRMNLSEEDDEVYDFRYWISPERTYEFQIQVKEQTYDSFATEVSHAPQYISMMEEAMVNAGYTNIRQLHEGLLRSTPEGDMLETAYAFDIPLEDGSVRSITVVYYDCYYENIEYIFEMTAYDGDYETAQYLLNEMVQTVDIWSAPGY